MVAADPDEGVRKAEKCWGECRFSVKNGLITYYT